MQRAPRGYFSQVALFRRLRAQDVEAAWSQPAIERILLHPFLKTTTIQRNCDTWSVNDENSDFPVSAGRARIARGRRKRPGGRIGR